MQEDMQQEPEWSFFDEYRHRWVAISAALFGLLVMCIIARAFLVAWLP